LQTRHYRQRPRAPSYFIARVIVETLKQTAGRVSISLFQIADQAKTTEEQVVSILGPLLELDDLSNAQLNISTRFNLAFEAVRHGALQQVARALTWQEFEAFTEECLQTVGFETRKGIIVKDSSRRWQIDIIAKKGEMMLAVDCKHWETPGYDSKLKKAADHQRTAVGALIRQMIRTQGVGEEGLLGLPVILTLYEPRQRLTGGAVAVSIEQFANFLEEVSPYSQGLPFITAQSLAKSSIS
jgi:Restriction endonuclease